MSNGSKSGNTNDHAGSNKNDANRQNDTGHKVGEQSQDALRHEQDAAHHKGPQQGGKLSKDGQ
jgi:hypothetical protein